MANCSTCYWWVNQEGLGCRNTNWMQGKLTDPAEPTCGGMSYRKKAVSLDPYKLDWSDLSLVKHYVNEKAVEWKVGLTVILRPRMTTYNVIHTSREKAVLGDAIVVYRVKAP